MGVRRQRERTAGGGALERLRAGVETAIALIGNGQLAHPHNEALRERLQSGDLSVQRYLVGVVGEGFRSLAAGIAPAAGDLFPSSTTKVLDDVHLAESVRAAAGQVLDAAWEAASREGLPDDALGAVHEALLDLVPAVRDGVFTLAPARENARRATGSYYTPPALVDHVLDAALTPVLERAAAADDPEAAILSLRVVDPACGSGRFLVAAARRIALPLARVRAGGDEPAPEVLRAALADVIHRCIYGVDVLPVAVGICRLALWREVVLSAGDSGHGRPSGVAGLLPEVLAAHVRRGDALLGASPGHLADGVPDAAWTAVAGCGEDARVARALCDRNARGRVAIDATEAQRAVLGPEVRGEAAVGADHALLADLWCAAFLWPRTRGTEATVLAAAPTAEVWHRWARGESAPPETARRIAGELAERYGFLHWHLAFPEVFAGGGGFDAVLGNPPFLNQLEVGVAQVRTVRRLTRGIHGAAVLAYTDVATLFLLRAQAILRGGGRQALVQPLSLVASEGAAPTRRSLATHGTITDVWSSAERVFPAAEVRVCVVAVAREVGGAHPVRRRVSNAYACRPPLHLSRATLAAAATWGELVADLFEVPPVELREGERLRDRAATTADFRDQFFGLVPHVREEGDAPADDVLFPRLVVTGLVDPATCLWGRRACRFAKRSYLRPRIDLAGLDARSALATWARGRLRPKIVVATQSRVLEAFADADGTLINTVPTITVYPHDVGEIWRLLAVLLAPPVSAWALRRSVGAALSVQALKLSAEQVGALPLPSRAQPWDAAAELLREASATARAASRRALLEEAGALMCDAYGVPRGAILTWWRERLPRPGPEF